MSSGIIHLEKNTIENHSHGRAPRLRLRNGLNKIGVYEMKYGILRYPHQNTRYFDSTKTLLINEFQIMTQGLGLSAGDVKYELIGGVELLTFQFEKLEDQALEAVYRLSSAYILFQVKDGMLIPMNEGKSTYFKNDISSILKYTGKTNEDFTGMMINVGVFSSAFAKAFDTPLNILDPMCGRGTSLYEGLIKGYNVAGVEIQKTSCQEIDKFLKRYLKFHKYKHTSTHQTIHSKSGKGLKYTVETARSIDKYKAKDRRTLQYANGNTLYVNDFYKKDTFHVLVTDVPYGVQHKGKNKAKPVDMQNLLKEASSAWYRVLKKGGALVIAFNAYPLDRDQLRMDFEKAGFTVLTGGVYDEFEHWVEQAVNRDVFVARKD